MSQTKIQKQSVHTENNEIKSMLHDAGILLIITLIAGIILGFIYQITKEPIAKQEEIAKTKACQEVFSDAVSFEEVSELTMEEATAHFAEAGFTGESMTDVVRAAKDASGEVIGYVLTVTTSEGYGGDIVFTMGIRMDGTLNGISLLAIAETPGLGMKAESVLKPQFENKNVPQFEYTKSGAVGDSQIDAISGATITTEAITNGVNAGLEYFKRVIKEVQ